MAGDNSFELLSDVLDKLIDTQVQSSSATSELRIEVQMTNEHLKEAHRLLVEINKHFSNGFRLELKEHINKEMDIIEEKLDEKAKKDKEGHQSLITILQKITSPLYWIKAFLFVGSLFGVIAAIVAVILKLMGGDMAP